MMVRTKPIEGSIRAVVQSEQGFKASVSGEALMRTQLYWLSETEWKTVAPLLPCGCRAALEWMIDGCQRDHSHVAFRLSLAGLPA